MIKIFGMQVESDAEAVNYLEHLPKEEVAAFFEEARLHGKMEFQDDQKKRYNMTYNSSTAIYTIGPAASSGWF